MTEPRPRVAVSIASCFGVGRLPIPGTFGAAVGLGIVVGLARLPVARAWLSLVIGVAAAVVYVVGVWAAGSTERYLGRTDPGEIVVDEVVGQMVTLLARPDAAWKWLLAGFVLFRIFDVLKPFPARRAEHLPGGWGVMTDDVFAGLYSLVALALLGLVFK
ncbi:MAG TPA: phosphatidylglycerophosphatase A [Terriglobia bacterium]|nr:phosphatidylglycerophosphatase A [Terriglobia bacterium]